MTTKATKCNVNSDGSVSLEDILNSFNSSIREEHAWALCYQCAKFYLELGQRSAPFYTIADVDQVFLQTDGNIHPNTHTGPVPDNNRQACTEQKLITGIGCVIYNSLDKGYNDGEERSISADLDQLINEMITDERSQHETDDEGIERDSEEGDDYSRASKTANHITLQHVIARCERHLASLTKSQAESHYRAVVRALVAEALELATFLEKVAQGTGDLVEGTGNRELEQLQFADWARFWVQVIQELRTGVKLKKVNCSRAPIEYELTPYEILMNDIKSRRYNLRKIMIDGNVPSRVTKDAHAIILDFIRSRPTLRKVSDRKLNPQSRVLTPREQLMNSIRKGRTLRKTPQQRTQEEGDTNSTTRKLIKVDFSKLRDDEDDDLSDVSDTFWQDEFNQVYENVVEAYDLALQCPTKPSKRYSLSVYNDQFESYSVPQSRPCSRQSCASSDAESVQLTPEIAQALQDNSKPWHEAISLDDRLSLTLEEIVHIRTVLTKAEVEALPVEGHVKSDVENRKVCFLCLKTRFGILGPWGHRCTLCKRTVCTKCIAKMCIPMEHFSSVPVVLLSPSIMASPEDDFGKRDGGGGTSSASSSRQPSPSRPSSSLDRFRRQNTVSRGGDKLRGSQVAVCSDCKMMVLQIIKSAQANRSAIRNKHLQTLTLNISPVF